MIQLVIIVLLGIIMLVMAGLAVHYKNLAVAIIAAGVVSLFASIMYVILAAPDVAMTEAAIGSGLTTIIFFYVLNKIRSNDAKGE